MVEEKKKFITIWDKCYSMLTRGAMIPDISRVKSAQKYKKHFIYFQPTQLNLG